MIPTQTVVLLKKQILVDTNAVQLVQAHNGRVFGSAGVEAGGRIVLGTATTGHIVVYDSVGKVLHDTVVTSNKTIDPIPAGVKGPIFVDQSSSDGDFTIYWSVKK